MGIFGGKKSESNDIENQLRAENTKLKEQLQSMDSIKKNNEELKIQMSMYHGLATEKREILDLLTQFFIDNGMDDRYVQDPKVLVEILLERFAQIDMNVRQEKENALAQTSSVQPSNTALLDSEIEKLNQQIADLKEKLSSQENDFSQRLNELTNQKSELENRLSEISEQKISLEQTLSLQKQETEDQLNEQAETFKNQNESEKTALKAEFAREVERIKANVGPSIEDQISLIKQQVVDQMQKVLDTLSQGNYIISCNGNDSETEAMQNMIRNGAERTLEGLSSIDVSHSRSIDEAQTKIQAFLLEEMEPISCWMRKLAIYSAYANIPFMIDEGRSDGIRFNREATMWSYALLDDMLASVGIKQIVPAPFIELFCDGNYEDATGNAIKNIGSFCPDYMQRIERVDRVDSANMIIDIADVGLMVDGQIYRQAKVIIQ